MQDTLRAREVRLPGQVICPGLGIGRVVVLDADVIVAERAISETDIPSELNRYTEAVDMSLQNMTAHIKAVHEDVNEHVSFVFEAHKAVLRDQDLHDAVRHCISTNLINAEAALKIEGERMMAQFEAMSDPFFRARVEDVRDIVTGIMDELYMCDDGLVSPLSDEGTIIATPHLHPTAAMHAHHISAQGFITESQALVSHAAILLKGFDIPTVGGVAQLTENCQHGDMVIVDALAGQVIIRPTPSTLSYYEEKIVKIHAEAEVRAPVECKTADGTDVRLVGNMGNPDHAKHVLRKGLKGVGLFRTEFFAMEDGSIPGEEEQTAIYAHVIRRLQGRSLVIRTFDIGADKQLPGLNVPTGQNPALGLRGIRRHIYKAKGELRAQYRAILRAAAGSPVGIMVPMVTILDDVKVAKRLLEKAVSDLQKEGMEDAHQVRFGAMIETPAAAITVADILSEVDFVSLGTNDLLQYIMAADRDNEDVLGYNNADSPAFLWFLKYIIEKAKGLNRQDDVTICGEIASRANYLPKLLQMGYRSFSISPSMADDVREVIAKTDLSLD